MRSIITNIKNLVQWAKVVARYRWWDYGFTLQLIRMDLEVKYIHWGKDTHYIGDQFTKKRIAVLLRQLDKYDSAEGLKEECYELQKFMKMYTRNLARLWD